MTDQTSSPTSPTSPNSTSQLQAPKTPQRLEQKRSRQIFQNSPESRQKQEILDGPRKKTVLFPDPNVRVNVKNLDETLHEIDEILNTTLSALDLTLGQPPKSEESFDDIAKCMQNKTLIDAIQNLLVLLDIKGTNARQVLSSLILVSHPLDICHELSNVTVEQWKDMTGKDAIDLVSHEVVLVENARSMLQDLSKFIKDKNLDPFTSSLQKYVKTFADWQAKSKSIHLEQLLAHFLQLEQLWLSVQHSNNSGDWEKNVESEQKKLLREVIKVGGRDGLNWIRDQLDTHRNETPSTPKPGDIPPIKTSPERFPSRSRVLKEMRRSDSVASTSSFHSIGSPTTTQEVETSIDPEVQKQWDTISKDSKMNLSIAHEIVIDPKFSLAKPQQPTLQARVKDNILKILCEDVAKQVEEGSYGPIKEYILQVKTGLLTLVDGQVKTTVQESLHLDQDQVEKQVENKQWNVEEWFSWMSQTLETLAIAWNVESRLSPEGDLTTRLHQVFTVLDELHLGQANALIQQLRPFLSSHAHEFERERLEKLLASRQTTLDITTRMIDESVKELTKEASQRNSEGVIGGWEGGAVDEKGDKFHFSHATIYNHLLLSILFSSEPISPKNIPELLSMDGKRLWRWQNEIQRLVIVANMSTLGSTFVKPWKEAGASKFASRCLELLKGVEEDEQGPKITIDNLQQELLADLNKWLKQHDKESLDQSTSDVIQAMVKKQLDPNDKMFGLMTRRLRDRVKIYLERGTLYVPGSSSPARGGNVGKEAEERIKRERNVSLATVGLDVVADELERLSSEISRLAKYNKQTYSRWWDELITKSIS